MPLRDHFRPPLSDRTSWEGVHGGWPMVIVQHLGRTLPDRYVAEPRVHLGSEIEVYVATLDRAGGEADYPPPDAGGTEPTAWAPAEPTLAVETELADADEYEVRVYDARHGRRLVAAVEIVSPANKDRPERRGQFVAKCAALLRQGVSVVMVDPVTVRDFHLYAELLEWVGRAGPHPRRRPAGGLRRFLPLAGAGGRGPLAGGVEPPSGSRPAAAGVAALAERRTGDSPRLGSELRADVPRLARRLMKEIFVLIGTMPWPFQVLLVHCNLIVYWWQLTSHFFLPIPISEA